MIKFDHYKKILLETGSTLFVRIFLMGCGFLSSILITRTLGAELSGLYFLCIALVTILSALARVGMNNTITKTIAIAHQNNDWPLINTIYSFTFKKVLIISISFALLLFLGSTYIAENFFLKPELQPLLKLVSFAIVVESLLSIQAHFLQGLKKIVLFTLFKGLIRPLLLLFLVIFLMGCGHFDLTEVITVYLASSILAYVIGFISWSKISTSYPSENKHNSGSEIKDFNQSSNKLFAVTIMSLIITHASLLALGHWSDSKEIAIYSMALRLVTLVSFILMAVNSVSAPQLAKLYANKQHKELQSAVVTYTRLMIMTTIPFIAILVIFPHQMMSIYGPEFTQGSSILTVLSIGYAFKVATGSVGILLMMTGHEAQQRNNLTLAAVVMIISLLLLVPQWGALGAAWATTLSLIVSNLLGVWQVHKKIGIRTL